MRKLTFDELWGTKWDVWNAYSTLFNNRPLINHPHINWFNQNSHGFEWLKNAFETIRDSEPEVFDLNSERGQETYSIYMKVLCFMYFIYYALSLKIKRNGYKEEKNICVQKIRGCLKKVLQENANGSKFVLCALDPFGVFDWKHQDRPLHFKSDLWLDKRLQDYHNFINGQTYNTDFTSFHLWLLNRYNTADWENVWLQGSTGPEERLTFFSLAQYCAYVSTPTKLYQNVNNFIIKDFLDAPLDSREYVVFSMKTKQMKMDKGKLWTTIETTSSVVKILYLDLIFRYPNDYKKEEYFYHHIPKKKKSRLFKQLEFFPKIIDNVAEVIKHISGLCYSDDTLLNSPTRRRDDKLVLEEAFKTLFNLPKNILDEYPALYRLMYLLIPYIDYIKFKELFQKEIHAPIPFDKREEGGLSYREGELGKLSVKEFVDNEGDIKKVSKFINYAVSDLKRKGGKTQSINIDELKRGAYSVTETAICLLYNIVSYVRKDATKAIIQQINFCGEQRERLFDYHKVKSSFKDAKRRQRDEYLSYKPTERECLDAQQKEMMRIDNGIKMNIKQVWPYFERKEIISRDISIKIFLETDICCNIDMSELYARKRESLVSNKYMYHERNMDTHYTHFNSTEELLSMENYKDLVEFLYKMRRILYNDCVLREYAEELRKKKFSAISLGGFLEINVESCEKYNQILRNLKIVDKALEKYKTQFINSINNTIDSDDNKNIYEILSYVKIDYENRAFFKQLSKDTNSSDLMKLCKQISVWVDFDSGAKKIEMQLRELHNEDVIYSTLVEGKEKLVQKYNSIVDEINFRKSDDDSADNSLREELSRMNEVIWELEDSINFWNKKVNIIQLKETLKKNVKDIIDKEVGASYAKRYVDLHKSREWEGIKNLLKLHRVREWQEVLQSSIIDEKILRETVRYSSYYQIQETNSLIEKMETISQMNLHKEDLQKCLDKKDYRQYDETLEKIAVSVEANNLLAFDKKNHIDFTTAFPLKERMAMRKNYFKDSLDYMKKLINCKNWKKMEKLLRHIEYYDVPFCSLELEFKKEFLNKCLELLSIAEPVADGVVVNLISEVQKSIENHLALLKEREQSKKHWSLFVDDKEYDNPILQKTQELFLRTLQVMGQSKEALKQCDAECNTNENNVFIGKNGVIKLNYNDIKKMMSGCHYDDELKKELREYLDTIFCVSHICDNEGRELHFFEHYGNDMMDYLIRVTMELAKLESQKLKRLAC